MVQVAATALGASAVLGLPWTYEKMGPWALVPAACGLLVGATAALAYAKLEIIAPMPCDKTRKAFTPATVDGGRLYFEKGMPILELDGTHPFKAGKAHGQLVAKNIQAMRARFDWVLYRLPRIFGYEGKATPDKVEKHLNDLKKLIPQPLNDEMKGLVEGFNEWAATTKTAPITFDELLLFQLLPDSVHFEPFMEGLPKSKFMPVMPEATPACTTIAEKSDEAGIILARNMDWPSFNVAGANSLIIRRTYRGKTISAEVGIAGLVGTITGINRHGLSLAMNVCSGCTQKVEGLSAAFFNRVCLESLESVDQVQELLKLHNLIGPYHLTMADKDQAISIHFHQGNQEALHLIRPKAADAPLIVTNCRYNDESGMSAHRHYSEEREERLEAFFKDAYQEIAPNRLALGPLLEHALAMPYVNNFETTHTVLMHPETRSLKVGLDNAFSATTRLTLFDEEELFPA